MPLFYVAGASGAGKSTVCAELARRGHPSYDVDADGLAVWLDRAGNVVPMPDARDDAWFANHTYTLPPAIVRRLAAEVGEAVGFVCGTVGNEGEIWDLFAHVISLSVDAETVRRRLAQRPDGFGSTAEELQRILTWHATIDADNARFGATLVDAGRPLVAVVDEVLEVASEA
ncbi:AAA family ATPase [Kribbella sp. NPDC051587]|uniref:AAA family ATPase n=1 Tax=Kribbella sp. NPDC051587 TaxID=3364119 RepID=UPI0037921747